jgi:hypothetical protein
LGKAKTSLKRGDALLQVAIAVDEKSASTLSEIEALGWRPEHAGNTFIVSGTSASSFTTNVLNSIDVGGQLTGVYLFRRP